MAEEPLLFHCGPRALFPLVVPRRVSRVLPVERLRWITFGHVEADECGCDEPVARRRPVGGGARTARWAARSRSPTWPTDRRARWPKGEVLDIGGHRLRQISTPHVPHAWEAQVLFDESTGTLLCGDLFTRIGNDAALVHDADMVTPALAAEDMFNATCRHHVDRAHHAGAGRAGSAAPWRSCTARRSPATAPGRCADLADASPSGSLATATAAGV